MPSDKALIGLAVYDDPALKAHQRRRLDRLLEHSSDARRELERQRAVRTALSAFAVEAPPSLRTELERLQVPRRARSVRVAPLLGAGGLAALALAVVLALIPAGAPSVETVAALAQRAPTEPAPGASPSSPRRLARTFAGVAYPNWASELGWRARGARTDELGERATSTVFYVKQRQTLAYTVVDGPPLDAPDHARLVTAGGLPMLVYRDGADTVVVFERGGRTCVLSARVEREETAIKLATWRV